jgi:asparagine synthase (glutamine-hydrolysing)
MGVKPLYLCIRDEALFFASEIKTILAMYGQTFPLNLQVVGEYVCQSLLDTSNSTFFEGITKVPAGHNIVVDLRLDRLSARKEQYWLLSPRENAASLEANIEQIRELTSDSVRLRLRSDVPVGVLLSGGIDSSSIAACMQATLGRGADLNLLSAVSDGGQFDESPFIDKMARHLGRPVTKVRLDVNPKSALELLNEVCWYNDEPVGSFSNVAHFLLMRKARELGITVILSGQGADEIFCGYKKYVGFAAQSLLRNGRLLKAARLLIDFWRRGTVINQFSVHEAKRYLPRFLKPNALRVAGPALSEYQSVFVGLAPQAVVRDRQILDVQRFSVPILTHYEDRMSMAWAREIRTPFLDYRLVEAAVSVPMEMKLTGGWTKFILRRAMEPLLPAAIAWRKDKLGFVNPEGEWLKHDLREMVLEILNGDSDIFKRGLISRANLYALYESYCGQATNRGHVSFKEIFQPIALEIWLKKFAKYIH